MDLAWKRLCTSVYARDEILTREEENGLSKEAKVEVFDKLLCAPVDVGDLEGKSYEVVTSSALHVKLKNAVYRELFQMCQEGVAVPGAPAEDMKEPLEHVRLLQEVWHTKVHGRVIRLCGDTKALLARPVKGGILKSGGGSEMVGYSGLHTENEAMGGETL